MEIDKIHKNIAKLRQSKGYTYENMAADLGISIPAYRKIEKGDTSLTVARVFELSNVLEVDPAELLGIHHGDILTQNNHDNAMGFQKVEHYYTENQETLSKLLQSKNEQIDQLNNQVGFLKKIIEEQLK